MYTTVKLVLQVHVILWLKYSSYQLNVEYNKKLHNPHRWHDWAKESSNPTSKNNIGIKNSRGETLCSLSESKPRFVSFSLIFQTPSHLSFSLISDVSDVCKESLIIDQDQ